MSERTNKYEAAKKRIDELEKNKKFVEEIMDRKLQAIISRGNGSCSTRIPLECSTTFADSVVAFIDSEIDKAKKEMEEI